MAMASRQVRRRPPPSLQRRTVVAVIPLVLLLCSGVEILPYPVVADEMLSKPVLTIHGQIKRHSGNRLPGPSLPPVTVAAGQELVVVQGELQPQQLGDPFLPSPALKAPVLGRTRTDAHGHFQLTLPHPPATTRARVTVLLVVPGGYYLNAFDGAGRFASLSLPADAEQPLVLHDDRGALF